VWLVAVEQEFPESVRQNVENYKRWLAEAARQMEAIKPSEIPELRGFLYGQDTDGTHFYVDLSMTDQ
jgi:hypothetical protein